MALSRVEDAEGDWLRQSFMIPRTRVAIIEQRKAIFSSVGVKFADSSLGGNYYINPLPAYTEYADLPESSGLGIKPEFYNGEGMGPYYSEAFDDNAQVIHMRFGVPEFNSLTTFFTGFYDSGASLLARTGRAPGAFYQMGRALGFVATIPLWPIILIGNMYRWAMNNPASKYYFLKPAMPLYWNAVNSMANRIAVDMGIIPMAFTEKQTKYLGESPDIANDTFDAADIAMMHSLSPDIYSKKGGIDVYAVANRYTRRVHRYQEQLQKVQESAAEARNLASRIKTFLEGAEHQEASKDPGTEGINAYLDRYLASDAGKLNSPLTDDASLDAQEEKTGRAQEDKDGNVVASWLGSLWEMGKAELSDGSAFVSFRVNNTGTNSESFSSTTKQSDLQGMINSRSTQSRSMRFSFANGNVSDNIIAEAVGGIIGAVKDVAMGVADGFQVSGIAALWGSAFIDIPEHWDDSTFSGATSSFTIQLRSPYGNKLARYNNLMVPLTMLLAGVLPLSTGKHSYTSPFLCELWNKGRTQIRLGMITELSVSRGEGNLGWTQDDEPLGIDVTFTVKDLSTMLHMPITSEAFIDPLSGLFSEDTSFSDYLAVLSSLSMADQFYISRRLKLALYRSMVNYRKWTSPAFYANWYNGTRIGKVHNLISREIDRPE